jgi:putative NADH-flavin reductase
VRDPEKLTIADSALRVVQGDVAEYERVAVAMLGQDAVISVLGVGTPLKHDAPVIKGIQHIVRAMQEASVQRLIYLSFIGLPDSRSAAGPLLRYVARFPLRHEIADHTIKEQTIAASPLDWTIVRAPTLTNGPLTGRYCGGETSVANTVLPRLSRADVADFMLRQLGDMQFVRKVVRVLP